MKNNNDEEKELMDTLGLQGDEEDTLIDLVETGLDEDEALDLIGDNTIDPLTEDPYENEETVSQE